MYSFSYCEPVYFSMSSSNCCPALYWGQTMVEVMKIMVTSFKRSHAWTATLHSPNPEAGHHWPTPLLETPDHSQASLGQSLVGTLLSPGSWYTGSVCVLQVSIFQSCVSSRSSKVRFMVTSSNRAMPYPSLLHPEPLRQSTADPSLHRRCSNTVLSQSLWGLWVLVRTRFIWALWASLVGMGFDSKHEVSPPTVLLGPLLCPWTWGISSQPHIKS